MKQSHSIDLLFSLSLFMVFVICSFLVLLFQIDGYHGISDKQEQLQNMHTPLAYVQTQILAHDEADAITLFHQEGVSGLRIHDAESKSMLYIYEQDHNLKELRVNETNQPDFHVGNSMFEIDSFTVSLEKDQFIIDLTSKDLKKQTLRVPYQCL